MTRSDVVAAARAEIGTPFRHQGRQPGKALDCAGLLIAVADAAGMDYIDRADYSRRPSGGLLESALDAQPCLMRVGSMVPGDVLLMRFAGDPQHLAIYAGFNEAYEDAGIVHALLQARKVCEHRLTDEWRSRIVRIYRFSGVEA